MAIAITDEGANGVRVHLTNDTDASVDATLVVTLVRGEDTVVASAIASVEIPARGAVSRSADEVFQTFHDVAYAYRFGPAGHDVVVASLRDGAGNTIGEAFHFPAGMPSTRTSTPIISANAVRTDDGIIAITLHSTRFAQSVALDAGDFVPDDNYFHMTPGATRTILARTGVQGARFDGFVQPLNAYDGVHIPLNE